MGHWDRTRQDGPLTVKMEQHDDTLIVRAIGELSRPTAEIFEAELRMAISGDAATVDLDLGAVGFIDSTGVRSVLRVANYSLRAGGRLRISRVSAPVATGAPVGRLGALAAFRRLRHPPRCRRPACRALPRCQT